MKKRLSKVAKRAEKELALVPEVVEDDDDDKETEMDIDVGEENDAPNPSSSESEGDENDSDKELQIALRDGLLKTDSLNLIIEKKRPLINKVVELRAKLEKFAKNLPWLESMDVTVKNESLVDKAAEDDFQRELLFYKQAENAVRIAVPRLLKMGVKVFRPSDYYAEMAKSDDHMQKVRKRLLAVEEGKQRQEAFRRLREEKKYAAKVQKEVLENKQSEKKKLMEAVKKHKKGMKAELEQMLENAKRLQLDEEPEEESGDFKNGRGPKNNRFASRLKRAARNRKFGFGGQKKRSKQNTKESFSNIGFTGAPRRKTGLNVFQKKGKGHGRRR